MELTREQWLALQHLLFGGSARIGTKWLQHEPKGPVCRAVAEQLAKRDLAIIFRSGGADRVILSEKGEKLAWEIEHSPVPAEMLLERGHLLWATVAGRDAWSAGRKVWSGTPEQWKQLGRLNQAALAVGCPSAFFIRNRVHWGTHLQTARALVRGGYARREGRLALDGIGPVVPTSDGKYLVEWRPFGSEG